MDDLTKRLRDYIKPQQRVALCREAADEIEWLRKELEDVAAAGQPLSNAAYNLSQEAHEQGGRLDARTRWTLRQACLVWDSRCRQKRGATDPRPADLAALDNGEG